MGFFEFLTWFIESQLCMEKAEVWQNFFKNFITVILLAIYIIHLFSGVAISNDFMIILAMVFGFYFNDRIKRQ